ncbi:hypothetical protein WSM22_39140 [Cytophagales bacterium WSM2-2]|nr:hypothetical protein WSM22_39140 [Cytophagales bacterium WSM2-2]
MATGKRWLLTRMSNKKPVGTVTDHHDNCLMLNQFIESGVAQLKNLKVTEKQVTEAENNLRIFLKELIEHSVIRTS